MINYIEILPSNILSQQQHLLYNNMEPLPPTEQLAFQQLKLWLQTAGATFDHLEVVNFDKAYRGVISKQHIQKQQRIIFIPKQLLITLELAKTDPISLELIQNNIQLLSPKHTFLAIFLLQEALKKNQSQWKHYIHLLPTDNQIFPINYSKAELLELTGSPFLFQVHERVFDLKRDYDKVFAQAPQFRKYTFFDFCWARTMVGSRMFGVLIDQIKTNILVPFADMLNHRLPKQTCWNFVQEQSGFCIQSLMQIEGGVQIYDSYGKKCNSRYLLNYGFVIENNEMNQMCLKINLQGPLKEKKLEMIKKTEGIRILKISANMNENNFYEAMGFLRFKNIAEFNQLAVLQKISGIKITNDAYLPAKTPPITIQLQLAIWKDLEQICQSSLKEYPTTLQEDYKMLQRQDLTYNMRNILILRSGEKKLYSFYIETARKAIDVLSKDYVSCFEELVKNKQQGWAKYMFKMLSIMPHQKKKQVSHLLMEEKEEIEAIPSEQDLQDL